MTLVSTLRNSGLRHLNFTNKKEPGTPLVPPTNQIDNGSQGDMPQPRNINHDPAFLIPNQQPPTSSEQTGIAANKKWKKTANTGYQFYEALVGDFKTGRAPFYESKLFNVKFGERTIPEMHVMTAVNFRGTILPLTSSIGKSNLVHRLARFLITSYDSKTSLNDFKKYLEVT